MSRYYALVLVPGDADTPEEEACEAAAELLFPYMRAEDDNEADYHFEIGSCSRMISADPTTFN